MVKFWKGLVVVEDLAKHLPTLQLQCCTDAYSPSLALRRLDETMDQNRATNLKNNFTKFAPLNIPKLFSTELKPWSSQRLRQKL